MTSPRKIQANRANARTSTGPKTARGKARAARNASRHGLSMSVIADPMLSEQVAVLAREIAGETSDENIFQLARRVAEAQIDLIRVRQALHELFVRNINDPNYISFEAASLAVKKLIKFARENGMEAPVPPDIMKLGRLVTPQGSQKVAPFFWTLGKSSSALTAMNGGLCRGANLPFGPSTKRDSVSLVAWTANFNFRAFLNILAERSQK